MSLQKNKPQSAANQTQRTFLRHEHPDASSAQEPLPARADSAVPHPPSDQEKQSAPKRWSRLFPHSSSSSSSSDPDPYNTPNYIPSTPTPASAHAHAHAHRPSVSPSITSLQNLTPRPVLVRCPHCRATAMTAVRHVPRPRRSRTRARGNPLRRVLPCCAATLSDDDDDDDDEGGDGDNNDGGGVSDGDVVHTCTACGKRIAAAAVAGVGAGVGDGVAGREARMLTSKPARGEHDEKPRRDGEGAAVELEAGPQQQQQQQQQQQRWRGPAVEPDIYRLSGQSAAQADAMRARRREGEEMRMEDASAARF
ncbi:hypothetical protein MBLNU459_g2516t1 [Dothideomycetes sp. NU459]